MGSLASPMSQSACVSLSGASVSLGIRCMPFPPSASMVCALWAAPALVTGSAGAESVSKLLTCHDLW